MRRRMSKYLEYISRVAKAKLVESIRQTVLISHVDLLSQLGFEALM